MNGPAKTKKKVNWIVCIVNTQNVYNFFFHYLGFGLFFTAIVLLCLEEVCPGDELIDPSNCLLVGVGISEGIILLIIITIPPKRISKNKIKRRLKHFTKCTKKLTWSQQLYWFLFDSSFA